MKILNLTITDHGGAGRAAFDLHRRFNDELGYDSRMVVLKRTSNDPSVLEIPVKSRLKRRFKRQLTRGAVTNKDYQFGGFNEGRASITAEEILRLYGQKPDVINLFWVNGYIDGAAIRRLHELTEAPLCWYLTDMAPMTGGCHFSIGCEGFKVGCFGCPAIQDGGNSFLPSSELGQRMDSLATVPLTLIAGTSALESQIRQSTIFRNREVRRIGYYLDEELFCLVDQERARSELSFVSGHVLPLGRRVIAVGSTHMAQRRKGMPELVQALTRLDKEFPDAASQLHVLFCGNSPPPIRLDRITHGVIGNLSLSQLGLFYNSCDFFVSPSIDDIGPFMLLEAMLCEKPVIAFKTGVALDVIADSHSGLVCKQATAEQLSDCVLAAVQWSSAERLRIGKAARESALSFYGWNRSRNELERLYSGFVTKVRS